MQLSLNDMKKYHGLLKQVLKPYDNRSHRQFDIVEIVNDFFHMGAAHAIKITCDDRKQKSYCVNWPLGEQKAFGQMTVS